MTTTAAVPSAPKPPAARRRGGRVAWAVMALAAIGTTVFFAVPYAGFDPANSRIALNEAFPSHIIWLGLHAIPACVALAIGPFQFATTLRNRYPAVHRVTGRVYLVSVLIGSVVGLVASLISDSGFAAATGFFLLAIIWFYSGLKAYTTVRRGQYQLHRVWMIRNYALAFAAVMLRVFFVGGQVYYGVNDIAFDENQLYTFSAWGSILVCLVAAEWFIVQRTLEPKLTMRSQAPARHRGGQDTVAAGGS